MKTIDLYTKDEILAEIRKKNSRTFTQWLCGNHDPMVNLIVGTTILSILLHLLGVL